MLIYVSAHKTFSCPGTLDLPQVSFFGNTHFLTFTQETWARQLGPGTINRLAEGQVMRGICGRDKASPQHQIRPASPE